MLGLLQVPGSLVKYLTLMEKVEGSAFSVCCVAIVLRYLAATKNKALIDKYKVLASSHAFGE